MLSFVINKAIHLCFVWFLFLVCCTCCHCLRQLASPGKNHQPVAWAWQPWFGSQAGESVCWIMFHWPLTGSCFASIPGATAFDSFILANKCPDSCRAQMRMELRDRCRICCLKNLCSPVLASATVCSYTCGKTPADASDAPSASSVWLVALGFPLATTSAAVVFCVYRSVELHRLTRVCTFQSLLSSTYCCFCWSQCPCVYTVTFTVKFVGILKGNRREMDLFNLQFHLWFLERSLLIYLIVLKAM